MNANKVGSHNVRQSVLFALHLNLHFLASSFFFESVLLLRLWRLINSYRGSEGSALAYLKVHEEVPVPFIEHSRGALGRVLDFIDLGEPCKLFVPDI